VGRKKIVMIAVIILIGSIATIIIGINVKRISERNKQIVEIEKEELESVEKRLGTKVIKLDKPPQQEVVAEQILETERDEEWIYFNLGGVGNTRGGFYKMRLDGSNQEKIFDINERLRSWAIEDEKMIYASEPEWDMIYAEKGPDYKDSMWHNNFTNAIYSVNEDGANQKCIVKGDIYNIHDSSLDYFPDCSSENILHYYEVLFADDGWIYFQTVSAPYATGGWFIRSNLSKIRPDGTELTKLNDAGVGGDFKKIIDGWAYFNSSSYGGQYGSIKRMNLEIGEISPIVKGASIIGILEDTLYFVTDYKPGIYSINIRTMEEECVAPTEHYGDVLIYIDGDKMYEKNYNSDSTLIHRLDLADEEIKNMHYNGHGRQGLSRDGYLYYVDYIEKIEGEGDSRYTKEINELYKKDMNTGNRTLLLSHEGGIGNLVICD